MGNVVFEQPRVSNHELTTIQSQTLNIFWTGFAVYTIGFSLSITEIISNAQAELFQVIGILLFSPAALALIRVRLQNNYLKVIFALYSCWVLVIVFRGFSLLDYVALKKSLFDPNSGLFIYFVPFIILFPTHLSYYKKLFALTVIITISYLAFDIIFFKKLIQAQAGDENSRDLLDYLIKTLGLPAGFLLLTYVYHSRKVVLLAGSTVLLTVLLAAICGRRGLMFIFGTILIYAFIIHLYENRKQIVNVVLSVIAALLLILYATSLFYAKDSKIFSYTKGRLNEDSRSVVELYFYDDMNQQDWLIGRGMNGLVAAPASLYDDHVPGKPGYRDGIETDYLKIILKGGIISLGLMLLIAVPAIVKGLFYSKNILSKVAALWIIVWLLSLYPSNVTTFTLNYVIVWISIGVCYSKTVRSLPEPYIRKILRS